MESLRQVGWSMVLATLVLVFAMPQAAAGSGKLADKPAPSVETAKNFDSSSALPESPTPRIEAASNAAPIRPATPASGFQPAGIKPAISGEYGMPHKKVWLGLMAAGHGAAVFDAWSTRRAVSGGYGTESNPLLRAASHSNAIYGATQVSPAVMDFIGRKMMTSRHGWMRKLWWVPQAAGTSFSFAAAAHNTMLVP
jgi:hypothetical protein